MELMLEEIDGEPSFAPRNEFVFNTIHVAMHGPRGSVVLGSIDETVRTTTQVLLRQRGRAAFKFAAEQFRLAYQAGKLDQQDLWRKVGQAVLDARHQQTGGNSFHLAA